MLLIYAGNNLISDNSYKNVDLKIGFYAVTLLVILQAFVTTTRCTIFTYLFFTLWIYVMERIRRGDIKLIWIIPATMIIWANLHAGFVSGLGLLGMYVFGEFLNYLTKKREKNSGVNLAKLFSYKNNHIKFAGIFVAAFLATFINPYGKHFWNYIFDAVTMRRANIVEWMPTNLFGDFQNFIAFKILLVMIFIGWVYKFFVQKDKKIDFVALVFIAITFVLALKHLRHQVFFAIAVAIFCNHNYFYEAVKNFYEKIISFIIKKPIFEKKEKKLNVAKMVFINIIVIVFCVYYVFMIPVNVRSQEPEYPARAVEFIKINNLKGNLLTSFNWGSYAFWKLYPQCLIFEDGRYEEVYFDESDADLDKFIYNKAGWSDIFRKYHHDFILVNNNTEYIDKIMSLQTWKIVYQDYDTVLFVPVSMKKDNWLLPQKDINYDKTKYQNTIDF